MEKYFVVTQDSELNKEYWAYRKNKLKVQELVKTFMEKHNINGQFYSPTNSSLYIETTPENTAQFDEFLKNHNENGLRAFKKNSQITKDWLKTLEDNELEIIHRPTVAWYFDNIFGKVSSRLFDIDNVVYCSIQANVTEINCPVGMTEIKASEFFKIIETHEETNAEKTAPM